MRHFQSLRRSATIAWGLVTLASKLESASAITPNEINAQKVEQAILANEASVLSPRNGLDKWISTQYLFTLSGVDLMPHNEAELERILEDAGEKVGWKIRHIVKSKNQQNPKMVKRLVIFENGHVALEAPETGVSHATLDVQATGAEKDIKIFSALVIDELNTDSFSLLRVPRGIPSKTFLNQQLFGPQAAMIQIEQQVENNSDAPLRKSLAEAWADSLSEHDLQTLFSMEEGAFDVLEKNSSKFQKVQMIRNKKTKDVCLQIDQIIQICESYNAAYSEVYVHLPIAFLQKLTKVLIVGGGDALALAEVLKYQSLERVVQLELDPLIPDMCVRHMNINAHLPSDPNPDPRVEWVFGDAAKTLDSMTEEFDLILVDISETGRSNTVQGSSFLRKLAGLLSPAGILIKNENYQQPVSKIFPEFLEITYPVPMIAEQTFVLGSFQTPLLVPNFKLLEENDVATSFLHHGPSTKFRQFRAMVKRYIHSDPDSDELDQEYFQRTVGNFESGEASNDQRLGLESRARACQREAESDPQVIPKLEWRKGRCEDGVDISHASIIIKFANLSPFPLRLQWLNQPDRDDAMDEIISVLAPGQSELLATSIGARFRVEDIDEEALLDIFRVETQIVTHPVIIFMGLKQPILAKRE